MPKCDREMHPQHNTIAQALQLSDLCSLSWSFLADTGCPSLLCSEKLPNWIGEWSCFVFGQAIAMFLKSTTTLVNLDLSENHLFNEAAKAWDSGRTDLILLSVWAVNFKWVWNVRKKSGASTFLSVIAVISGIKMKGWQICVPELSIFQSFKKHVYFASWLRGWHQNSRGSCGDCWPPGARRGFEGKPHFETPQFGTQLHRLHRRRRGPGAAQRLGIGPEELTCYSSLIAAAWGKDSALLLGVRGKEYDSLCENPIE